jgi:hypothetical protein
MGAWRVKRWNGRQLCGALLALVTAFGVLCAARTAAATPLPTDMILSYEVYVRGRGWTVKTYEGDIAGNTEGQIPIEAVRFRVENRNGALYPGYSLCYRVLRTGSTWTSQVCNGSQAGTPNGGRTLQAISVTLSTPAAIAGNICYSDHAGTTGWQNSACDGGYSGGYSGAALLGLYALKAGGETRGRHVRNVYELSAADRTELANRISTCITEDVVATHHTLQHGGIQFLIDHRNFVRVTFEICMKNTAGWERFLPLPFWNPGQPIPPELRGVKALPGHDSTPLQFPDVITNPNEARSAAKSSSLVQSNICWLNQDAFVSEIANWHNYVHNGVGGVMQSMDSPTAIIFWPWHANIDNIYNNWLDCRLTQ